MTQKTKETKRKSVWYVFALLVILIGYYFIAPKDLEKNVKTFYQSLTQIEESIDQENSFQNKNEATLEIYFWNVGQADSTLVACDNEYMLIDAGNNADGKLIVNQLKEMGIQKIHYLIGTHPHEDHIGGLDNIIKHFKIGKFYMPNRQADSMTFEDVLDVSINQNLKITTPKQGTSFMLGKANCKILSAESNAEDTNDSSIVIQLNFGKHKYLFTGDLTSTLESNIKWEDVDVLKVAHHGSRYSTSKEFLEITKPEVAIISDGTNNDYGHPHKETLNRLKKVNAEIYRTDKNGTIYLKSDGAQINIEFFNLSLDGNRK